MAEPRLQLASVQGKGHPSGPGSAPGQAGKAGLAWGCPGAGQMGRVCSAGWVSDSTPRAPLHTPPGPACARDVCDGSPGWGFCSVPGGGAQGPVREASAYRGTLFSRPRGSGAQLDKEPSVCGCPASPVRAGLSPSWETGFSRPRPAPVGTGEAQPPGPGCPLPGHWTGTCRWLAQALAPGPPRVRSHWHIPHTWGHQLVQALVRGRGTPMAPLHWPLAHRPDPAVVSGCPYEDRLPDPTPWPAPGFSAPPPWLEPSHQGRGSQLPAVGVQVPDPGPLPRVLRPLLVFLPPPSCLLDGNKSTEGLPASCGLPRAARATAFGNLSFRNASGNSVPWGCHSPADPPAQYSSARSPVCPCVRGTRGADPETRGGPA